MSAQDLYASQRPTYSNGMPISGGASDSLISLILHIILKMGNLE